MKFKTELHLHSAPVSACGKSYPEEIVQEYLDHGYHTVVLTNHFSRFTFNNKRKGDLSALPWQEKVDYYMSGFEELKKAAEGKLNVLFGCELRSNIDENDYLIYGLDEAFLRNMTDFYDMPTKEVSAKIREAGFLFLQAHPFRDAEYMDHMRLYPRHVHGLEVYNASRRNEYERTLAEILAENYHLLRFAGSDNHIAGRKTKLGGMRLESPILNEADFVERVKNGKAKPIYMNLKIGRDIFDL